MRTIDPTTWPKKFRKRVPLSDRDQGSDGLEMRLRKSLQDVSREYLTHSSMRAQARMADPSLSKLERWQHGAVWVLALCWGACAVWSQAAALRGAPAQVVTRRTAHHSVQHIPFPAVALCSNNVIARKPLNNLTAFLDARHVNNSYRAKSIRKNLLHFGSLLTMDLPDVDVNFIQFLAQAHPNFNITRLMGMFSSSCESMLRRCSWQGKVSDCSHLFTTRITPLGFCCVFNSRYNNVDMNRPPKYLNMLGEDNGLIVVVQENPDDFAFLRRASIGLDVLLFDGREYPILEGGGVRMYPVEYKTSAFMAVSASTQRPSGTAAACRRRSAAARESYAWCLTECRRRTLDAVCGCRLYTLPPDSKDNTLVCSLIDLPCLNKHREKLTYYYPEGYSTPALEEELQNGQACEQCAPDCSRVLYSAAVSVARYTQPIKHKYFRRAILNDTLIANSTVIRLFYSSDRHELLTIEASQQWYESFALLCSMWSVMTGATLAAGSELVFYHSIRWLHHYRRRTREAYWLRQFKPKP